MTNHDEIGEGDKVGETRGRRRKVYGPYGRNSRNLIDMVDGPYEKGVHSCKRVYNGRVLQMD